MIGLNLSKFHEFLNKRRRSENENTPSLNTVHKKKFFIYLVILTVNQIIQLEPID